MVLVVQLLDGVTGEEAESIAQQIEEHYPDDVFRVERYETQTALVNAARREAGEWLAERVRPDGPETAEGGLIGQEPY